MQGADHTTVSTKAKQRGRPQLGTLGAGNHYCEVQVVGMFRRQLKYENLI